MKRLLCVVLCMVLLCGQSLAAPAVSLEERVKDFLKDNGLNEENFSFSYYNLKTGESFDYNESAFFSAGDVWLLPLHMYYYEQEAAGAYAPPLDDPDWEYTIDGMSLEDCRFMSILQADAEVSRKMRENLGDMRQYKLLINEAFGHLPENALPEEYLDGNAYNTRFLMNCLKEIALHPEQFTDMLQNFALIQPNRGFAAGEQSAYLVHVYGRENMVCCDVGEVSGNQRYLLAAFVSETAGGDSILSALQDMLCSYAAESDVTGGGQYQNSRPRSDTDFLLSSGETGNKQEALTWIGIAVGVFAVLGGIAAVVVRVLRRNRSMEE